MIDVVCVRCGYPQSAHWLGSLCQDGERAPEFFLLDSHALDDVPPARRAEARAELARRGRTNAGASGTSDGASA